MGFAASSSTDFTSNDLIAEPRITGTSSPRNLYFFKSSLTSDSTKSIISGSSTVSHLFKNTTIFDNPT